ncbi:type I pantothenate kinase [Candidatus Blochmannia ocreatus (nom. nud.)]|uniref:Pantothenate kinase n=1 Tax=Candidatus Blochmannia ocreatus (nom. nud.) TaxID=251538 RepID=A0ABY4STG9_9ENTR|nr:type I pantothenate kinase [Candidatus Blochmannia ocreatus]URJ25265.1 type I pantothenate kinase [Candidatus Blochmannia ocreatus]
MSYTSYVPFFIFNRKSWSSLREGEMLTLSQTDIFNLKKINNHLSINDIIDIYVPLSKLLNLYYCLNVDRQSILKSLPKNIQTTQYITTPYVIGITGSVSAGKSTAAKILQILLSRWPQHRIVELVTTDGFLHNNKVLQKRNLMKKKGFPQSYDMIKLINFILQIKSGAHHIAIPIYSHKNYDIVPNIKQIIYKPDILILEGLNILQNYYNGSSSYFFMSDLIDFSIYVDAPEYLLREWYINRFLKFCFTSFSNPNSYFYRYSRLSKKKIVCVASNFWSKVNGLNLQKNILPSRNRAHLILKKGKNHVINNVYLRKF